MTNSPSPTLDPGLATLPPVIPWHGKTIYAPPSGANSQLIGVGPDDTIYVLVERPLPVPKPTPSGQFVIPELQVSVIALQPDGSMQSGWPSAGVPVSGYPMSYAVGKDGTVFVATAANPSGLSQHTITAIGSDGNILPGWPYRTPAAQQPMAPESLVPGLGGVACFVNVKPGVAASGHDVPMLLSCLGRDGRLLPGWPYSSELPLWSLAIGPDGTVYVAQATSSKISTTYPYAFPYQVLAIGLNDKPKPGWTPWARSDSQGISAILPTQDGRVYMLLGGDAGKAQLVDVDRTGRTLDDHVELGSSLKSPNYKDAVLTSDGSLFVSVTDQGGDVDFVNAYSANGSQMTGWPQLIGGWGDLAAGPQGSVWVAWTVYGLRDASDESSVVALFDKNGKLQPGYPMAADQLMSYRMTYGLQVASDGTAYGTVATASGSRIVAFGR